MKPWSFAVLMGVQVLYFSVLFGRGSTEGALALLPTCAMWWLQSEDWKGHAKEWKRISEKWREQALGMERLVVLAIGKNVEAALAARRADSEGDADSGK